MNKAKPTNRARLALPLQSILLILLIGGIGVQTLISCSSDDSDGPPPPLVTSSSSFDGNSSSSGGDGGDASSSSGGNGDHFNPNIHYTFFTDIRDNKTYRSVTIGDQTWMAENLNWDPGTGNSVCYKNDPANCNTYGRLYDWPTAMGIDASFNSSSWSGSDVNHQGICPDGWHIPSNANWNTLIDYTGGSSVAGAKLKATSGWNENGNGTDNYGFSALPGGYGNSGGLFSIADSYGYWWSSSEGEIYGYYAYHRSMHYYGDEDVDGVAGFKSYLYSVRCIQD